MKFIKFAGSEDYFEWDINSMKAYNFAGGHHYINENSDSFMNGTIVDADSWHHLYVLTGYNPMRCGIDEHDCWLDPEGNFYYGNAHAVQAKRIVNVLLEEKAENLDVCDDYLRGKGWVKLTTSLMMEYYQKDGMYNYLTPKQRDSFNEWCILHDRVQTKNRNDFDIER